MYKAVNSTPAPIPDHGASTLRDPMERMKAAEDALSGQNLGLLAKVRKSPALQAKFRAALPQLNDVQFNRLWEDVDAANEPDIFAALSEFASQDTGLVQLVTSATGEIIAPSAPPADPSSN